jgi:p24 family protein delta-1
MMNLLLPVGLLLSVAVGTEIQFPIAAGGTRCFGEELSAHDLLVVKAKSVDPDPALPFTLLIKTSVSEAAGASAGSASVGSVVFKEENKPNVMHAFTSVHAGPHWVCITNPAGYKELNLELSMRSGVHAKDYNQIAKKDHLEPAQVAMRRITDLLREYRSNLFYQRRREERMRETTDSTATRALTFCIINILMVVLMGLAQALFFRRFFRAKKII